MLLPSRLSTSTLGDLLGALHRQGTTGLLELCELWSPSGKAVPGRLHRVQLHAGLVTAVETPLPAPRLGELLERRGVLCSSGIARLAAATAARAGGLTGEQLLLSGLITRPDLEAALREQLRARLDVLYTVEEAAICFHTARPLTDSLRRVGPLQPPDFLHGRPRTRDKRRAPPRAYSAAQPPRPQGAAQPPPPPPRSQPVRVDERRLRALHLLGLREGATEAEVRRAFRRLAADLHPDRATTQTTARFAELSAAYHLLVA